MKSRNARPHKLSTQVALLTRRDFLIGAGVTVSAGLLFGSGVGDGANSSGEGSEAKEVPLRIILVTTRQEANEIRKQLKAGESFEKLAREYSIDPSSADGGYIGKVRVAGLQSEIREALRGLRPDQVTGVIETPSGYMIVKVLSEAASLEAESAQRPQSPDLAYIQALDDPSRDLWQQPDKIIKMLDIKPGETIADLGSGPGYFTLRFARAVGPTGKVFGIDVSPEMLTYLKKHFRAAHLGNIEPILAKPDNPELSPDSVDMIFICATLHLISNRASYYPFLTQALKPGGQLVIIDFYKRPLPLGPPVSMKISQPEVIKEAESAGFHLVRQYRFLEYQYFMVFKR